jgi:hypothetical protein
MNLARLRRRPFLLLGLLVVLLLVAGGGLLLLVPGPHEHHINEVCFGMIRKGMTQAEVEEILGGPAGNCRSARKQPVAIDWWFPGQEKVASNQNWLADDYLIYVGFSSEGTVLVKLARPQDPPANDIFSIICRRLGL